jgi:plasmid stabilization system protein ParE
MDFKVVWTEPAIQNLREIGAYISRDNPSAAIKFGEDLFRHVEVLETFPFIGPAYPRGAAKTTREIIFRKYLVFSCVSEEQKLVEILAIWHGAQDNPVLGE